MSTHICKDCGGVVYAVKTAMGLMYRCDPCKVDAFEEARGLVMDIEVQGDGDLLALTRDRAIEAEQKLAFVLSALKEMVANYDGIRDALTRNSHLKLGKSIIDKLARAEAAISRAEGKGQAA